MAPNPGAGTLLESSSLSSSSSSSNLRTGEAQELDDDEDEDDDEHEKRGIGLLPELGATLFPPAPTYANSLRARWHRLAGWRE